MAKKEKTEEKGVTKNKSLKKDYIYALGRRREAVARVRFYPKSQTEVVLDEKKLQPGEIIVNGQPIAQYFFGEIAKVKYEGPLHITSMLGKCIVTVVVSGGGKGGQLDAIVHGIARAIVKHDKERFQSILKKKGFLTRDPRAKERRKVGTGGKARRKKQSPKR
ncbi:MAG: 30S ribosomal protein S9 [Candidatus Levybacteria bacterium]|nr:30S ribosomal protein S9 [Candidatus Levybacteria bacterium]